MERNPEKERKKIRKIFVSAWFKCLAPKEKKIVRYILNRLLDSPTLDFYESNRAISRNTGYSATWCSLVRKKMITRKVVCEIRFKNGNRPNKRIKLTINLKFRDSQVPQIPQVQSEPNQIKHEAGSDGGAKSAETGGAGGDVERERCERVERDAQAAVPAEIPAVLIGTWHQERISRNLERRKKRAELKAVIREYREIPAESVPDLEEREQFIWFLFNGYQPFPVRGKRFAEIYKKFRNWDRYEKYQWIRHWYDETGGFALTVPENYLVLDCDNEFTFRYFREYAEYGGLVVKSPRGGKIMIKKGKREINYRPVREGKMNFEVFSSGRTFVVSGKNYKILKFDSPCFGDETLFEFFPDFPVNQSNDYDYDYDDFPAEADLSLFARFAARKSLDVKTVVTGQRNNTLFRFGRSLRCRGYSESQIRQELAAVSRGRCEEPLPADEFAYLVKHIFRYRDRPGFVCLYR